ncbi:MAG: MltA domain-containing protein [Deltaproteobacteria bacterium]|nr:MltA domain-containing protein [Deltaproteobacteria bacterium]
MEKMFIKLKSINYQYASVIFVALALCLLTVGCDVFKRPPLVKKPALYKISPSQYPDFEDDMNYAYLEHSIPKSIEYLKRLPSSKQFEFGQDSFRAVYMIKSLEFFLNFIQKKGLKQPIKKFIESHYVVYRSAGSGKPEQVLFTGYYEPLLQGSLEKDSEFEFPVYSRPDDLMTVDLSLFSPDFKGKKIIGRYTDQTIVPYYERKKIESDNILEGRAKPLAWVKDQVDLFFLQIQGSGKIHLSNGEKINVHYHTYNGRPYKSIGKLLIEQGKIPRSEMSMQKIRDYLKAHKEEVSSILNYNQSYVFFKIEEEGPLGCLEVTLTPGRSIATDRRVFPQAALAFIETKKPLVDGEGRIYEWNDFSRFVLNQDTGGAIRGPGRADLFWGNGPYAEIAAGHMQHSGNMYFLILKPEVLEPA